MTAVGSVTSKNLDACCFEWKITDYFLPSGSSKYFTQKFSSPPFTFSSCNWKLEHSSTADGWIAMHLGKETADTVVKTVAFTLGLKKADGTVEERGPSFHTFHKNDLTSGWSNFWSQDELVVRKAELLSSDAIIFTCRMVNDMPRPVKEAPQSMKLMKLKTLSTNFKDLFISKNKCDFIIKVQGEDFPVHKAVLMARSSVFAAMFKHMKEKESGSVSVPDCDPDSFGDFLQYLYTGNIEGVSFRNAYHIYATANKYDVQELKSFCVSYMIRNLSVENVCDVVALAEKYEDDTLMSSGQAFFNYNFGRIFSTGEWKRLMRNNYLLAYRLLQEMASKVNPGITD